jgi:LPS sulfotransferase NodH
MNRTLVNFTRARALGRTRKAFRGIWEQYALPALGALRPATRCGNVVIFHVGRSGSTVLTDLLGQHPKIFWDGEPYERLFKQREEGGRGAGAPPADSDPFALLRNRMGATRKEFYGFSVKFFHLRLLGLGLPVFVQRLGELGYTHYVVLERRNYLRKIVSSLVAHRRSQFHRRPWEEAVLTPVEVDVERVRIDRDCRPLLTYLREYREGFEELDSLLEGRNVLRLVYEDDLADDPLVGYRRVCEVLGVPEGRARVRYGKTNPFPLSELVSNFDAVEGALRETPFAWMLYE